MLKTVFLDLDGTLLNMDQEFFMKVYFQRLADYVGCPVERLAPAIMAGTYGMVKNDGKAKNREVFWRIFRQEITDRKFGDEAEYEKFYSVEFNELETACGRFDGVDGFIRTLQDRGLTLVLATNPVFPLEAQKARIRWAGLQPGDFCYITSYENSSFCKPNPAYYTELLQKLGLQAGECAMIGNDVEEDMAAEQIGMKCFLLTYRLLNPKKKDISPYVSGGYPEALAFLQELQGVS